MNGLSLSALLDNLRLGTLSGFTDASGINITQFIPDVIMKMGNHIMYSGSALTLLYTADKIKQCYIDNNWDEGLPVIDNDGTKRWYMNGNLHRDGDLPAIEYANGTKKWFKDGKQHRDGDLPAIEDADGSKQWFKDGKLHRDGGLPAVEDDYYKSWWVNGQNHRDGDLPAIEDADGSKTWLYNGKLHRVGGPAIIEKGGGEINNEWWFEGHEITEDQHDFICRMWKRAGKL